MAPASSSSRAPWISPAWLAAAAGGTAAAIGALLLQALPPLPTRFFAAGAARIASILLGAPLEPGPPPTLLAGGHAVAVTTACSGTDFFLMVAALLGWRRARPGRPFFRAILSSLALALPITLLVNGLRVAVVTQAQHWLMPLLPAPSAAFAHMLAGAAVFLPALIALNFVLEYHARRSSLPAR